MSGPAKKRRRPARAAVTFRWILVGTTLLITFFYYRPLRSYFETRNALTEKAAEVRALRAQNEELERRVAASGTPAALAREARRIGLVKPGERLFIVKGIDRWRRARMTTIGKGE